MKAEKEDGLLSWVLSYRNRSSGTLLISQGFKIRNGFLKSWRRNSLHMKSNEFGKSSDHTCGIIHVKLTTNLRHKAGLSRYKGIGITPCILSYHHGLKLYINKRNITNLRKLKNSLLNEKREKTEINK